MNQEQSSASKNIASNIAGSSSSSVAATAATVTTTVSGTTSSGLGTTNSGTELAQSAPSSSAAAAIGLIESAESSDNDTSADFSRLTDLLQARGLPTHIVNAFGSKVQQFLHRTMSSGITSRSQQLINSLQQHDESVKLTALAELCQLLVMGNEDTLVGFPVKQAVPLLLQCMSSESENFDLMNHACRALTYMMESLPRSSSVIADGIGIFLEKLQVIQCMDVAEQSLTALEILSRRHSKQILNATQSGSISACLTYIDFFSITAQRNALQITANCCQNMVKDEFVHIQSSLSILSQRLTHSDKKSVESVCTVFARLVENFQRDPVILKEIASHNVLANMQQLLVIQPAVVSSSMFVTILHTIYLMCAHCNELSIELLENNIVDTLKFLLIGNNNNKSNLIKQSPTDSNESNQTKSNITQYNQEHIEILSSRSPQELYEIVTIIGEIMPRLPQKGIFAIDETLRKTSLTHQNEHVIWQWKDERDVWRPYTPIDIRIIEAAFSQEEDECILNTMGRTYVIDFNSMLQINEETGTARPVIRKVFNQYNSQSSANVNTNDSSSTTASSTVIAATNKTTGNNKNVNLTNVMEEDLDHRLNHLIKNPDLYYTFVSSLFAILYEVYSSSAGPAIKHRSLRALLRMIYYTPYNKDTNQTGVMLTNVKNDKNNNNDNETKTKDLTTNSESILYNLLKNLPISSNIASMLASQDTKIIVSALQMCEILMQKLPDIFSVYFHREGVIYQIDRLIESSSAVLSKSSSKPTDTSNAANNSTSADSSTRLSNNSQTNQRKTRSWTAAAAAAAAATIAASTPAANSTSSTSNPTTYSESNAIKRKVRTSQASTKSSITGSSASTGHHGHHYHSTAVSSRGGAATTTTNTKSDSLSSNQFNILPITPNSQNLTTLPPTSVNHHSSSAQLQSSNNSLTSSTAKYFRNIITKMHNNTTTSTSGSSLASSRAHHHQPSTFQTFSLIAPPPAPPSSGTLISNSSSSNQTNRLTSSSSTTAPSSTIAPNSNSSSSAHYYYNHQHGYLNQLASNTQQRNTNSSVTTGDEFGLLNYPLWPQMKTNNQSSDSSLPTSTPFLNIYPPPPPPSTSQTNATSNTTSGSANVGIGQHHYYNSISPSSVHPYLNQTTTTIPVSTTAISTSSSTGLIPIPSRRKTTGHHHLHSHHLAAYNSNQQSNNQSNVQTQVSIDLNLINENKEKVRQWICDQAKKFKQTYFSSSSPTATTTKQDLIDYCSNQSIKKEQLKTFLHSGLNVLSRLKHLVLNLDLAFILKLDEIESPIHKIESVKDVNSKQTPNLQIQLFSTSTPIAQKLSCVNEHYMSSLKEISNILHETDISSFEMIHSGLIEKILYFLSLNDTSLVNLQKQLSQHHSINYSSFSVISLNPNYLIDANCLIKNEFRVLRCKQFLNIFASLPLSYYNNNNNSNNSNTSKSVGLDENRKEFGSALFSVLLSKIHNCINQLEQFAVRVHDVPTSVGYGKTAIKFFNTHQLKCLLQRHPSSSSSPSATATTTTAINSKFLISSSKSGGGLLSSGADSSSSGGLRQWKGGPVKVDPLAPVSAIEKYLIMRGIHRPSPPPVTSSNFLSSSFPSSSTSNQKSIGHYKPSSSTTTTKSKPKSKSPSSRLFLLKAAAEMATDKFKSKKSKQSQPAHVQSKALPIATITTTKVTTDSKKQLNNFKSARSKTLAATSTETKEKTTNATSTIKPVSVATKIKKEKLTKAKMPRKNRLSTNKQQQQQTHSTTKTESKRSTSKGKRSKSRTKSMDHQSSKTCTVNTATANDEDLVEKIESTTKNNESDIRLDESIGDDQVNDNQDEYEFNEDIDINNEDEIIDDDLEEGEGAENEEYADDDQNYDEDIANEDQDDLDEIYDNQLEDELADENSNQEEDDLNEEDGDEDEVDDDDNNDDHEDDDEDDEEDDDDDDDGDIESAINDILGTSSSRSANSSSGLSGALPKLELLINDHVIPSNMTIYQAIKLYSTTSSNNSNTKNTANVENQNDDLDNDIESSLLNNAMWSKVHLIHYRLAQPATSNSSKTDSAKESDLSKRTTRFNSKQTATAGIESNKSNTKTLTTTSSKTKKSSCSKLAINEPNLDVSVHESNEDTKIANTNTDQTVFYQFLTTKWPAQNQVTLTDQSLDPISLLRLLNAVNRNWYLMYKEINSVETLTTGYLMSNLPYSFLTNSNEFINTKLTAKANRQLQDPLVIMTGHLPKWLPELMRTCSFLFPFETRLMYFYVSSLDRDRSMQKLIDLNADLLASSQTDTSGGHNDRIVPKLDKKKRTINRNNDLIKQADAIISEFAVNNNVSCTSSQSKSSSFGGQASISGVLATTTASASTSSSSSSHKPALLEIQYENEVGTGLGPTLEFYALISLEIQKCEYEMWRGEKTKLNAANGQNQNQLFYYSPNGLFPSPVATVLNGKQSSKQQAHLNKLKSKFKFLGKFVAKAVMDFRVLDIQFSYVFYKWLIDPNSLSEEDIRFVDSQLYKSFESLKDYLRKRRQLLIEAFKLIETNKTTGSKTSSEDSNNNSNNKADQTLNARLKLVEEQLNELEKNVSDLDLDFTLPGYNNIELKKNGKDILVNLENLDEYLKLIVDWTLNRGVQSQLEAFKEGFETILPLTCLQQFYPEELERLFCGSGHHVWTTKTLIECTRCDHGFTHESRAVKYLFEIMCSFTPEEQRQFLQFITGSPRLPVGGLRSLVPPLTIVRKTTDAVSSNGSNVNPENYLPSVMTCVNYLKLPDYSSIETMREKLVKAMKDGQLSFHLS